MIVEVKGSVLGAQCIAHQCNCVTVRAHGLAKTIADQYPWADVYGQRTADGQRHRAKYADTPGTIKVEASKDVDKVVICMFAQWAPGKSGVYLRVYPGPVDDAAARLGWFKSCVDSIDALLLDEVAVPDHIGCGLAGGDWFRYKKLLEAATTRFVVYKL